MNHERTVWHIGIGFCIACLLFAGIVIKMELFTRVPAINAERASARARALAEIRAAETQALNHPGWVDESRGLLRLPIETAMQITERVGRQDPAAVRANLANRVEKATAPAPAAPAKPSAFE